MMLFFEFSNNGCRIFESGHIPSLIVSGVVLVYLSALLLLPWWVRVVLLLLPFGIVLVILTTNIDTAHIAAIQASAVGRVRTLQGLLEAYKEDHPREGFPELIPLIKPTWYTEKYYRFEYTPTRNLKDGPAEDYVLKATPIRPDCGCRMRLITSSDRIIHWNFEDRPATKADPKVGD